MTDDPASPPDPAAFVGRTWSADPVTVERWDAFLWAAATRDPDERFRYPDGGVQYAPPTFAQVLARRAAGTGGVESALRGPAPDASSTPAVFLGGWRAAFRRPPAVGRTYHATAEAVACEHKTGATGAFDLLTVEYRVEDGAGLAFELATDFVIREGSAAADRTADPATDPGASTGAAPEREPPDERRPAGPVDPDHLAPGDVAARRVVDDLSPADMRTVTALVGDPNPIHFDPEYAADRGLPGRVNQGPVNAAYAGQAALSLADSPADLRSLSARYEGFAFEGETVVATATVEDVGDPVDASGVDGGTGGGRPVDLALTATAGGRTVVSGSATVRLETSGPSR